MKFLVTGANGFLGHHLVKELLSKNFEVYAMVRNSSDVVMLQNLKCNIVYGDILDIGSLLENFHGMDGVFHTAGAMSSNPKDKENLFAVNVQGVKNVIEASSVKKIKKLIHVSSVVAVGVNTDPNQPLLNENSKNITKNMGYANYDSKRIGEELVIEAVKNNKISAVVVNPGLIYGEGDARKKIRKGNILAARGRLPIYTSGGVNVVAVEDVCLAMITAYEQGKSGERYLLTGDNITVKKLLTTISELAGAKAPNRELPNAIAMFFATIFDFLNLKFELSRENIFSASSFHWYDNSKARRELNFNPKSYKYALKSSVDWMKSNGYLNEDK